MNELYDFELHEEDLLGYSPDDIACAQCGGVFCGLRVGRIYRGKPLILCSRKPEVKGILARETHADKPSTKQGRP